MSAVWGSRTCNSTLLPRRPPVGWAATTPSRAREIAIHRKDGSRIRAALSLSRVEIDGQIRTIAFVRDVTAEVERRQRLDLLTLVADRTNRAVILTDRRLRIVYTNAAFEGMFGYSFEEAQGRPAMELLAGRHTDRTKLTTAAPPHRRG